MLRDLVTNYVILYYIIKSFLLKIIPDLSLFDKKTDKTRILNDKNNNNINFNGRNMSSSPLKLFFPDN